MKQLPMFLGLSCAAAVVAIALSSYRPPPSPPGFSVHDLKGKFAFVISGEVTLTGPLAAVGIIEADGHGNFPFATRTLTVGGQLILQDDEASGTYTVNPNGTGTATFNPVAGGGPQTFDFAIVNSKEFFAVSTTPGVVAHGPARKQ